MMPSLDRKSDETSTLSGLADALQRFGIGVGRPSEKLLLSSMMALKGLDPSRSLSEHYRRDSDVLRDAGRDALPALREVLIFLKNQAEIPHLRLLPRAFPFIVLTKFFGCYANPNNRTIELLVRWLWRILLTSESVHEGTLLRHSLKAIEGSDPEQTLQRLLKVVPHTKEKKFTLPQKFDARRAYSRIVLVALSSLEPRSLENGSIIDIADLFEENGRNAFRRIMGEQEAKATQRPANGILLPPTTEDIQQKLVELIQRDGTDSLILHSHCINQEAAEKLVNGEFDHFLSLRGRLMEETVDKFGSRLAAWGVNDRPSINHILQQTGEEE